MAVGDALARAHDVAVLPRSLQHERGIVEPRELPDHRPPKGEPISSSGLHTYVIRPHASNPGVLQRPTAKKPVEQPALHVRDTRARAHVAFDAERTLGNRTVIEHRVHVSDEQHVRTAAPSSVPITRSPNCGSPSPGACARRSTVQPDRGSAPRKIGDPVDARHRVRAAIDVHHLPSSATNSGYRLHEIAEHRDVHRLTLACG